MVRRDLLPLREKLLALRARFRGMTHQMATHALHDTSTARMPDHMAELGSDNFHQELSLSLLGSERATLGEIEAAMARLDDGTYGRCESCGRKIAKARLQAVPYAARCVRCATDDEQLGFDASAKHRVLPR